MKTSDDPKTSGTTFDVKQLTRVYGEGPAAVHEAPRCDSRSRRASASSHACIDGWNSRIMRKSLHHTVETNADFEESGQFVSTSTK